MLMNTNIIRNLALSVALLLPFGNVMANTAVSVEQVTTTVSITDDVDYHITSSTPFASGGSIDIVNTEHAVVIFEKVKPSKAVDLLQYVKINGQTAVNNLTCQVKIYNQGAIVMPYASDIKPLTVYSGQNFEGTAVNDFGLENTGGFMNTLTDEKLNNRIRSFKLKRGYMVTFSTRAGGYGYSRCFVADTEDLEMKELPAILDQSITSYRVFKWNDTSKKGLANNTGSEANTALNTTWCYAFGLGEDTGMDRECVAHHIHEQWPAIADCGRNNYTTSAPTMKTNNEPGNSSDDQPATVDQVLANWEKLMATGLRLCTPSSHDGSLSWMQAFVDSIDARGWRCDVVDVHSYWVTGSFYNLPNWYSKYRRPIWVTEWCWGASWNKNGAFSSSLTDAQAMAQNAENVQTICELMNSYGYVERYSFWNSEADRSKLYLNGALTAAGKYYSAEVSGVGYNKKYDYVPSLPKCKGAPTDLAVKYDSQTGVAVITWHEKNGEYNKSMTIERRLNQSSPWVSYIAVTPEEQEADYAVSDNNAVSGAEYRIHVVYADGKDYYTQRTAKAVPSVLAIGDAMDIDGTTWYVGGNQLVNGDFDLGTRGWTNGLGDELSAPDFEVFSKGGCDGGAYLQCFSNKGTDDAGSVKLNLSLVPESHYYFTCANLFSGAPYHRISLTSDGSKEDSLVVSLSNSTVWTKQAKNFTTGSYSKAILSLRWLGAKAQFDQMGLYRLFSSRAEALADGVKAEQLRAKAVEEYNTVLPQFNTVLQQLSSDTDASTLSQFSAAIDNTIKVVAAKALVDSVSAVAKWMTDERIDGYDVLQTQLDKVATASTAADYVAEAAQLRALVAEWVHADEVASAVINADFSSSSIGWTACGTYTGGKQDAAKQGGRNCWSAYWSGIAASESDTKTMAVSQTVQNLTHGLYFLECKAATQHHCLSDQHAYIQHGTETETSPALANDWLDIDNFSDADKWQTLTTAPVYVAEGEEVVIGFTGSKRGAKDNAWKEYGKDSSTGDKREGWWCATDFVLRRLPVFHTTVDASGWGTLCLPYAARPTQGVKFYQIAGITADNLNICLEEISEAAAGTPCIIHSETADVVIQESGDAVTSAKRGEANLYGVFKTSATAGKNYLVLRNGCWVIQDSGTRDERAQLSDYSAYLRNTDSMSILDSWSGVSLPVTTLSGIESVEADNATAEYYTLDGKRVSSVRNTGVYLQKKGGKMHKVSVK